MKKTVLSPIRVAQIGDTEQHALPPIAPVEQTRGQKAAVKAIQTAKTATILAKAHLSRESRKYCGRWQWVDFLGENGRESAGIVDILAIRKRWEISRVPEDSVLKHLDLFDIMLIQVKGGSAKTPSASDIARMEHVADHYRIEKVLLYQWNETKKTDTGFRILNRETSMFGPVVKNGSEIFGKKWPTP